MSDEFVEVTRQGWLSRVGGAIGGTVVGVVFFLGSFPLLWWNEGRAVHTYRSLQEGAGAVVSVPAGRVDPGNEGKLVHLSGRATTDEVLANPTFTISANALRLRRDVEMYQWVETRRTEKQQKLGGSEETVTRYMYETAWKGGLCALVLVQEARGAPQPGEHEVRERLVGRRHGHARCLHPGRGPPPPRSTAASPCPPPRPRCGP